MNKYELRKTIGFKLETIQVDDLEEKTKELKDKWDPQVERKDYLTPFMEKIETFIYHFEKFIFVEKLNKNLQKEDKASQKPDSENNKNGIKKESKVWNKIDIKYQWLRTYTANDFFLWSGRKENKKKYGVGEIPYLKKTIQEQSHEWKDIIENLKADLNASQDSLKRRSQTALLINQFSKKQVFPFIEEFVYFSNPKEDEGPKEKLIAQLKEIKTSLTELQKIYLPFQSSGLVIAKASFNYYTINKKPKNYNKDIEDYKKQINDPSRHGHIKPDFYEEMKKKMSDNKDKEIKEFLRSGQLNDKTELKTLDLKKSYNFIKRYKSNSKALFHEAVSRGLDYDEIKTKCPLFYSKKEEEYKKFQNKTKEIEKINNEIEKIKSIAPKERINKLKEERTNFKKQRGKFFQKYAKKYISLCKNYEEIAQKLGKLNAQIRGIKKEEVESQLLNYWSLILEEQNNHELLLIHRSCRKEAKELIGLNKEGNQRVHQFYSLTLRALDKLCFGFSGTEDTEFLENIKKELPEYRDIKEKFSFENNFTKKIDETKLIKFYQKVLKSNYANEVLELNFFCDLEAILTKDFKSLDEFQSALEKVCYLKKAYKIDNETKKKLLKLDKSCLFKITSYDLSLHNKDINIRQHTKLWKEFWSGKNEKSFYPVRLNPEISVFWREKQNYRFKEGKYSSVKRNRFLEPQWNLRTSLTLNATTERIDLSFKKPEDMKEEIIKFNKRFYEDKKDNRLFYYGIDRGLKELATLCVIKEDLSEKGFSFFPFEIFSLKEEHYNYKGKGHTAFKNPSYFVNEHSLFNRVVKPTLDLTTAKLISGKIVENGDISTYLKFKELSAKRRLFKYKLEMAEKKILKTRNSLYIKVINRGQEKDETIYSFREDFKTISSMEDIQKELQNYLEEGKPVIKINHLRNSIASNISGILSFLYKKNPGLIVLEEKQKQKQKNLDEFIAVQLEWALYKKFQTEGLVPPCLKEVDLLYEKLKKPKDNNFGAISFINPENTSKICPKCNKKQIDKEKFDQRKKEGWFKCEDCDFDSRNPPKELSSLDTPDKIAAYNIGKGGKDKFRS